MWRTIVIAGALAVSAGCMSAAPPTRARTETTAAIRAAREVGAMSTPRAAYHLELAQEQLTRAEALIRGGRMTEAEGMLMRAQADAELAILLTREATLEAQAEELETRITAMREHM